MKRILVADDDPLVSLSIRLTLERAGYETVLADGGVTGLCALEAQGFDAMIVDIFMPQMRGFRQHRHHPHRLKETSGLGVGPVVGCRWPLGLAGLARPGAEEADFEFCALDLHQLAAPIGKARR